MSLIETNRSLYVKEIFGSATALRPHFADLHSARPGYLMGSCNKIPPAGRKKPVCRRRRLTATSASGHSPGIVAFCRKFVFVAALARRRVKA